MTTTYHNLGCTHQAIGDLEQAKSAMNRHSTFVSKERVLRKLMSQLFTTNRVIFVMTWVDYNKHRTVTIRLCTFFHSCLFTPSLLSRTDSNCFNVFSRRMFDIVTRHRTLRVHRKSREPLNSFFDVTHTWITHTLF